MATPETEIQVLQGSVTDVTFVVHVVAESEDSEIEDDEDYMYDTDSDLKQSEKENESVEYAHGI
jgi:hypothetical protein